MSRPAVRVEGLSKRYQIGSREPYHRFSELLSNLARGAIALPRRRRSATPDEQAPGPEGEFWALQDVSFEVNEGEVLGIVGRNGAGKSTLLKILSRITEPTAGRFGIRGRVASLLEVGTGFHPELTGRDNIYLNGAVLGMPRTEIARKFDEIVAFAEVEAFLETPVKHYSSGMYMRLAFSVAAHLDPEILVIDEVLAVGDMQFQKKCLGKMSKVAQAGRTVLFVSHNLLAVESLCTTALLLDGGQIVAAGAPSAVTARYQGRHDAECPIRQWDDLASAPGGSHVRLRRAAIYPAGADDSAINVHTELVIEFEYWNMVEGLVLSPTANLYDQEGRVVFQTSPVNEPCWTDKPFPRGLFRSQFVIPADFLNDGYHELQLYMVKDASVLVERFDSLLRFYVADDAAFRRGWYGKWLGAVRPNLEWQTVQVAPLERPIRCGDPTDSVACHRGA
ncbi:MAG TPA: ABC transporter ATP-binding protein [Pirellulales bacterium]|nr:ABC transporter ATP-binding protein [Pirellulales bacterium]